MVCIDPASAGFQLALLINLGLMVIASLVGYIWAPRLTNVIIAQAIAGVILYLTFPSIVVAFG